MGGSAAILLLVGLLLASAYVVYHDPADEARRSLHAALQRGQIDDDQYAAHLRAIEELS